MITFAEGKRNLRALIDNLVVDSDMNESQTRFHIIDILLKDCLGWKGNIEVEPYEEKTFADYELGQPRQVILEAKREGRVFEIPAGYSQKLIVDLESLRQFCDETKNAIEQVQGYCSQRGVQIAIASNGQQYIVFLATRTDGKSVFEGKCVFFDSLESIFDNFDKAWNYISHDGIKENNLRRLLNNSDKSVPKKLSSYLLQYPKTRYSNETQANLRLLSEIFIQDIVENEEVSESFIKECYCQSGELSQFSLLSKSILQNRYSALFDENEHSPSITAVRGKKHNNFTPKILAESFSRKPIVLLGDVGVGKTSFLKNLIFNSADNEFQKAITIYINLGSEASLTQDIRTYVLNEIENQLHLKYQINISSLSFIKGIYASEISKFNQGIYGQYKDSNPDKYQDKLTEHLAELSTNKDQHLKKAIKHYATSTQKQIIIIIDNADQRKYEVQQDAFIISQELAKNWIAQVFISVRPQTFYKSKRAGALSAYPHRIFTISPPRIDKILEKRLAYALEIAEGKLSIESLSTSTLNSESLSLFLKALLESLSFNKDIYEFLSNITGGNIRNAIELVVRFIGSPNVDCEKIINIMQEDGSYRIPLHEFTKSALLGDYAHYHSNNSLAMNLFDVSNADHKEHFLKPLILAYIENEKTNKDNNGFCNTKQIFEEVQNLGFTIEPITTSIRLMTNKKLLETSQKVTFEEDIDGLLCGDLPSKFRITSIGAYHLKKWMGSFTYIDAMVFDTPIFNDDLNSKLSNEVENFSIDMRLDRAKEFRSYLLNTWNRSELSTSYFDFPSLITAESHTFNSVERAVNKIR